MKRLLFFLLLASLPFGALDLQKTEALAGSDFQAGRIIDDGVFFNGNGLEPGQIQDFLNSKMPNCDTWHARSSNPRDTGPPYTCLNNYQEMTWSLPADSYCNGFSGGNKTATQIIYEIGVSCGINQKVILVTLQKEQSLITDTWPRNIEYERAMGYACPDTALPPSEDANSNGCDDDFEGFFRQVYYGTRQFKRYAQDTQIFTSYRPYRNNYIGYNPNSACGGTNVYIQNQATSNLYIYTPYQPNAAALNNLYGIGDGCSAYGNRNFWRLFNDWFGTTFAGAFNARIIEQGINPSLKPGQISSTYVKYRNTGNSAWYDDIGAIGTPHKPVRLATDYPLNHFSPFGKFWVHPHRPGVNFARVYNSSGMLSSNQHVAHPGETVEFWFAYHIPHGFPAGNFQVGFRPIVEGSGPMNDTGSYAIINVQEARYTAAFAGQSAFPNIKQGESSDAFMLYRNTGNVDWYDDTSGGAAGQPSVHLGTDYPLNRNGTFGSKWPYPHRAAVVFGAVYESDGITLATDQHKVAPGQIARFNFKVTASPTQAPGFYAEALRPIVQGVGPMNDTGTWMGVSVGKANYTAAFAGQSAFPTVQRGGNAVNVFMRYRNTGNMNWYDDTSAGANSSYSTHLGTDWPLNRNSLFGGNSWPYPHRAAVVFGAVYESDGITLATDQHKVAPGQIVQFNFGLRAPATTAPGFYAEALRPIVQGVGPMNDTGTWMGLNVTQ